MSTLQRDEILSQRGEDLYDSHGEKIGTIEEIYLDNESDEPEWALVKTGLFGTKSSFVPLRNASRDGDTLSVPFEKEQVKDAPAIDTDAELSQREEADLYRHYGLEYSEAGSQSGESSADAPTSAGIRGESESGAPGATGTRESETDAPTAAGTARDADDGDGAMTRSEEELRVGTTSQETGRARLRKYVETEDVTKTVPVSREEVRVEREPVTDENRDAAMSGPDISEGEHEVVLHEEEVVAEKQAVPKERIRLEKDSVTDEQEVSDTVRKERVEVDGDDRG
jgi:uncharacterized protein (TIGR02271 family)